MNLSVHPLGHCPLGVRAPSLAQQEPGSSPELRLRVHTTPLIQRGRNRGQGQEGTGQATWKGAWIGRLLLSEFSFTGELLTPLCPWHGITCWTHSEERIHCCPGGA